MMRADHFQKVSLGGAFDHVRLIPERVEKRFGRLKRPLFHTLRIASRNGPMRHIPKASRTRFIPCPWGVRRDDYAWNDPGGDQSEAAFRTAAASAAKFLLEHPLPAWSGLLPGDIWDLVGGRSKLYLADYWTLTLHHLVWSKKLPYAIKADWVEGSDIDDEVFYFVSELPVGLAEASKDALILFQEAALEALVEHQTPWNERAEQRHTSPPSGPPLYRNGRWRLRSRVEAESNEPDESPTAADHCGQSDQGNRILRKNSGRRGAIPTHRELGRVPARRDANYQ